MSAEIIRITLPDGTVKEFEKGSTGMDVALSISEGLARNVLATKSMEKFGIRPDQFQKTLTLPYSPGMIQMVNLHFGILQRILWLKPLKLCIQESNLE